MNRYRLDLIGANILFTIAIIVVIVATIMGTQPMPTAYRHLDGMVAVSLFASLMICGLALLYDAYRIGEQGNQKNTRV